MTAPVRIQRKRAKGWRMPPNTIYVGRPTKWGNPFAAPILGRKPEDRHAAVDAFRRWWEGRGWINGRLLYPDDMSRLVRSIAADELRGKNLACWCSLCDRHRDGKPMGVKCSDCAPCHADILIERANPDIRCTSKPGPLWNGTVLIQMRRG